MATLVELKGEEVDSIKMILMSENQDEMDEAIDHSNDIGIRIEIIECRLGIGENC